MQSKSETLDDLLWSILNVCFDVLPKITLHSIRYISFRKYYPKFFPAVEHFFSKSLWESLRIHLAEIPARHLIINKEI